MFVPPYSPLAGEGERRLPHYTPIVWGSEDIHPFDTLTSRPSTDAPPSEASHDDDLVEPTSRQRNPTTRPASRVPLVTARTFPTFNYDPWSAVRRSQAFEPPKYTAPADLLPPPEYDIVDTQARTFRLHAPLVYASKTSNLPQYQMAHSNNDGPGKPRTLKIRRLRPSETRSCSVPAIHARRGPKIRYDDDETMYTMVGDEMHGTDLDGSVKITSGRTLWGGNWTKIWHVSKPLRRDSWNSELERRRRPRSLYEGDKILLYTIKKGVWEDADGTVVAREEKGREKVLEIGEAWARDRSRRDMLVGCWIFRVWSEGEIRLEQN